MTVDALTTQFWLRRELIADGWNDRAIAAARRRGDIHRIRHGAYAIGPEWEAMDAAARHLLCVRAVVRQAGTEMVVSHTSAAAAHGSPLWGLPLEWVSVTRRDGRTGRRAAGVRQHRGLIRDGDVCELKSLAVMSPTRAALEVTTVASTEASLAVVNHLLNTRATTLEELRQRYAIGIDRWSFTLRTELVLQRAQPLCESVGESRFWHLCHVLNLPIPEPQFIVRDSTGEVVARLDFAWPELGVFVEFDGMTKYHRPFDGESLIDAVLREKAREDHVRELTGWRCVRVTWADLSDRPRLEARLRRAFAAAKRTSVA